MQCLRPLSSYFRARPSRRQVAYGSVTAGTSRFFQSMIQTLQIALGLAVGVQSVWFASAPWSISDDVCAPPDGPMAPWVKALATLVGFVSLSISLNAHWRQWLVMHLAAAASLAVVLLGRGWGLSSEVRARVGYGTGRDGRGCV